MTPTVATPGDIVVVGLHGRLSSANSALVHDRLAGLLVAARVVLVDLNGLQIARASMLRVFATALEEAGGWPDARLAVYTTDRRLRSAMRAAGLDKDLWIAHDRELALMRCLERPARVRVRWVLSPTVSAPSQVRERMRQRWASWGLEEDDLYEALVVVNELVSNAVDHARTQLRVHLFFDGSLLRIWVHDNCPRPPQLLPVDMSAPRGRGMQMVDRLSKQWGWSQHQSGKTVWAIVDPFDQVSTHASGRG